MKTMSMLFTAIILTSCSNTVVKVPDSQVKTAPQQEPVELIVLDSKKSNSHHHKEQVSEQEIYDKSLLNINRIMSEEILAYAICVKNSKKSISKCNALLKSMCQIDMLIDSRGGHHMKNYCEQ